MASLTRVLKIMRLSEILAPDSAGSCALTLRNVIRIGPAGWAYKDWEGIVYPADKPKGFDPVGYLAQYFETIEINSSFYGPPRSQAAKSWAERASGNPRFKFTAKLYKAFTHDRKASLDDERAFKDGINLLIEAGKLGALLLQFPWSFRFDKDNRVYLLDLQKRFDEYPLVLEVRHASWAQPEVLDILAELDIGLANIDQPLFHRSIKPGADVTAPTGYVRLHGRNYQTRWYSKSEGHSLLKFQDDKLVIAPSATTLFGILGLQLAYSITNAEPMLVCCHCTRFFTPQYKPATGLRTFCPACRKAGKPQMYAMQDYRARARA